MYCVAIERKFMAHHYLIGGDWGAENQPHIHQYRIEARVSGDKLDRHGYLLDIVELSSRLDKVIARYRAQLLNNLPPFLGLNPSIEHFARIIAQDLLKEGIWPHRGTIRIKLWENEEAWASYDEAFP